MISRSTNYCTKNFKILDPSINSSVQKNSNYNFFTVESAIICELLVNDYHLKCTKETDCFLICTYKVYILYVSRNLFIYFEYKYTVLLIIQSSGIR